MSTIENITSSIVQCIACRHSFNNHIHSAHTARIHNHAHMYTYVFKIAQNN